jgi:cephalosporin hydroxylase
MVLFTQHSKVNEIQDYLKKFSELFQVEIPQSWEQNRELTNKQFYKILEKKFITVNDYTQTDNLWALTEILHYINPSLEIKFGVNIILFGGAVNFLGTNKHRIILDEIISGKK